MVTIDPNRPIQSIVDSKTESDRAKPTEGGFDTIFKQAMDVEDARPCSAEPTMEASDIRPARFSTDTAVETDASIFDQTDQLMDTLEAYREKLGDNEATLKDVEPFMQQMASQSEALATMTQSEVGADDKLQGIVDQALALSSMEIAKYNSGYYNNG
ncbi:hypothetical protein [uncultured Desulfosarcina sp.]|uniref:hypothetical protein n=1 Tax=uncultured Desulfosarcina sp. TaxID=218289 RepID=UPI0029C6E67F|nr:hypothetical protein [uncultured Desulfosarcina sp.]